MFRAPFAATLLDGKANYAAQLLSPESLSRTPYFDAKRAAAVFDRFRRNAFFPPFRLFYEMGLCAAVATQLWHHLYFGGGLCDLPTRSSRAPALNGKAHVRV
jgi:asparagine synthase (glutamine-hydrolysing)